MRVHPIYFVLYIIAAVCFALAVFNVPTRVNLLAVGLLAWVLVPTLILLQS
jgi:hypothetical protein